jgi:DNA topoisomerase I
MLADQGLIKAAQKIHLRYIADAIPGLRRARSGKSFKFIDQNGVTIYNQNTIERIKLLAIPPAWKDVWISPRDDSHLQATGFDSKDRKQYIYHPDWIKLTQEDKFNKLVGFAELLPEVRNQIRNHLSKRDLSKEKVLATIVWLLEHTFIRIGNDEYARDNDSFGLTTLRNRHVKIRGPKIKFEFIGKSGVPHLVNISHPTVAKTIKQCIELPGFELFKCFDEGGNKLIIDSSDVNAFLKDISGEEISAKEFRTWGGTVLAATNLNKLGQGDDKTQENNLILTVKEVSKHLRNTPAVCRKYYIHPTVTGTYQKKVLVPHFQSKLKKKIDLLTVDEMKVLTLLQKYS